MEENDNVPRIGQVRAKFKLAEVRNVHWSKGKTLVLRPEYDESIPEDQRFAKATPSGELTMHVDNPSALEFFKLGEIYYLDFTPIATTAGAQASSG